MKAWCRAARLPFSVSPHHRSSRCTANHFIQYSVSRRSVDPGLGNDVEKPGNVPAQTTGHKLMTVLRRYIREGAPVQRERGLGGGL